MPMAPRVGVIGIGHSGFARTTPGVSYKELMFEAARAAYEDAHIDPRRHVDSFVCASEDFQEGTSIFDEYLPDQLGAVQKPVQTVASDGLFAIATAVMLIRSGIARVVAVEAHSKASDVVSQGRIDRFALDPVLNRPLGLSATVLAGLEMRRYLHDSGHVAEECSRLAGHNRANARANPRASYADASEDASMLFDPLSSDQVARSVDGCVVAVLADEGVTRARGAKVWVDGVGWNQGAVSVESRIWGKAGYVERAGEMAYGQAGVSPGQIDCAEVDDTYAYKQLQHLEALKLAERGSDLAVNMTGGAIGEGYLHEANGLARFLGCVERVRGGEAVTALAQSWRGVPSTSSAVAILRADS